jgi:hypothetical protein
MLERGQGIRHEIDAKAAPRTGRRRACCAGVVVFLGACAAQAHDLDAEHLRQLVEAEEIAGRVTAIRLVEAYRALGVTTARREMDTARAWADAFCARATREFTWNSAWRLIVHMPEQGRRAYSCRIPTTPDRLTLDER